MESKETTASFFVSNCRAAKSRNAITTKGGWLLSFNHIKQDFPTHVSIVTTGEFLIMLPIGNKVSSDFFPDNERNILIDYFNEVINELTGKNLRRYDA